MPVLSSYRRVRLRLHSLLRPPYVPWNSNRCAPLGSDVRMFPLGRSCTASRHKRCLRLVNSRRILMSHCRWMLQIDYVDLELLSSYFGFPSNTDNHLHNTCSPALQKSHPPYLLIFCIRQDKNANALVFWRGRLAALTPRSGVSLIVRWWARR